MSTGNSGPLAWFLLVLAVVAVAVTVSVGALWAHGTEEFNRWVGLATVAAVPLTAGGLILMFWDKITASLTLVDRSDHTQAMQRPEHIEGLAPGDLISVWARGAQSDDRNESRDRRSNGHGEPGTSYSWPPG